jgi:hypothetical protein
MNLLHECNCQRAFRAIRFTLYTVAILFLTHLTVRAQNLGRAVFYSSTCYVPKTGIHGEMDVGWGDFSVVHKDGTAQEVPVNDSVIMPYADRLWNGVASTSFLIDSTCTSVHFTFYTRFLVAMPTPRLRPPELRYEGLFLPTVDLVDDFTSEVLDRWMLDGDIEVPRKQECDTTYKVEIAFPVTPKMLAVDVHHAHLRLCLNVMPAGLMKDFSPTIVSDIPDKRTDEK